jgi:hypothetical protein
MFATVDAWPRPAGLSACLSTRVLVCSDCLMSGRQSRRPSTPGCGPRVRRWLGGASVGSCRTPQRLRMSACRPHAGRWSTLAWAWPHSRHGWGYLHGQAHLRTWTSTPCRRLCRLVRMHSPACLRLSRCLPVCLQMPARIRRCLSRHECGPARPAVCAHAMWGRARRTHPRARPRPRPSAYISGAPRKNLGPKRVPTFCCLANQTLGHRKYRHHVSAARSV